MQKLARECYAIPSKMQYPIHTKQAALQSWRQYKQNSLDMSELDCSIAERNFKKAADLHNINLSDAQYVIKKRAVQLPIGQSDTIFMQIPENEQQVLQMALGIQSIATKRPTKEIRKMAKIAMDIASQILDGSELQDDIMQASDFVELTKLAGLGLGDREEIADQFRKRASHMVLTAEQSKFFAQTEKNIMDLPQDQFYKQASLDTLCDTLEDLDSKYDMKKFYGSDLKRPIDVCYKESVYSIEKQASDRVIMENLGVTLSKKALMERKQAIKSYFDAYFGTKIENDDEIISKVASLSPEMAENLIKSIE